jgi:Pyruvate/2-oxoacid:ferredoxin oxidoreductase delta subunit
MLVELFEAIKPQLTIVDSIVGMEGDGPSGGKAKPIGLILAGQNGHSVDRIIAEILGIGDDLFTLQAALKKKIEGVRLEEVEILGERIEEVKLTSFKLPRTETGIGLPIPPFLRWFLKKFLVVRPVIKESLCQKCKVCLKICPPQAISQENGRLKINDTVCLRCFCCQELCRYNAIVIKRGFLPLK